MQKDELLERSAPLASVIIPCFNHGLYLADAVRSVLGQQDVSFEIIVVDDGSTDDTREVAAQFGDDVRYIWQENRGLSAARNTGLDAARGSFVAVLDADDFYEPRFLTAMVRRLEENPEAEAAYCGYRFVDDELRPLPQVEVRAMAPERFYSASLDGNFLVPESMLVRRRCYEAVGGFDESLRACEDWDMWLRIAARFPVLGVSEILTRHRILAGSMSTDPVRMLKYRLAVLEKHVGPEPATGAEASDLTRRAYARAYLGSCLEFLQYGNAERGYECFRQTAILFPDVLAEVDTFYQLGCGDQPKGSMGHAASLDLARSSEMALGMLDRLFQDPNANPDLRPRRREIYATAHRALSNLSYNAEQFALARRFLAKALAGTAGVGPRSKIMATFLKSLLGPRLMRSLRAARHGAAGPSLSSASVA